MRFPVFIRLLTARRQFSRSRNTIFAMIFEFSVHGGRARKLCRRSSGNGNTNSGRKRSRRRRRCRFDKTVTIPFHFPVLPGFDNWQSLHATKDRHESLHFTTCVAARHDRISKKKPSVHRRMDRNAVRQFYRLCIRMQSIWITVLALKREHSVINLNISCWHFIFVSDAINFLLLQNEQESNLYI